MSAATKRKHVAKEIVNEFPPLPDPPRLFVARILAGRGNNLHLVETVSDSSQCHDIEKSSADNVSTSSARLPQFLVSMPVKFRKSFWVKRGDFILCSPIEEGDKVKAEIARVLYKDDVRYIRSQGKWPKEFDDADDGTGTKLNNSDDDLYPRTSSSSSEDDEEVDESEGETAPEVSNGHNTGESLRRPITTLDTRS